MAMKLNRSTHDIEEWNTQWTLVQSTPATRIKIIQSQRPSSPPLPTGDVSNSDSNNHEVALDTARSQRLIEYALHETPKVGLFILFVMCIACHKTILTSLNIHEVLVLAFTRGTAFLDAKTRNGCFLCVSWDSYRLDRTRRQLRCQNESGKQLAAQCSNRCCCVLLLTHWSKGTCSCRDIVLRISQKVDSKRLGHGISSSCQKFVTASLATTERSSRCRSHRDLWCSLLCVIKRASP